MAATSLKLPHALKRQLVKLAHKAGQTLHAFIVETLAREGERAERRPRLNAAVRASDQKSLASTRSLSLDAAFKYLEAKAAGKRVKSPRVRASRTPK
jgi:hypothetical protein